jgi:galactose mutarotase-like enzyme
MSASGQHSQWVSLASSHLSAAVDPLGAQLSALRDHAGRDLLWDGDPAIWSGRSPILFPIVGALAGGSYRLGDRQYSLGRHGFARGMMFEVAASTPASAEFRLKDTEASLRAYPFRFELRIRFELDGPTLRVTAIIRNTGDDAMPASFGFHPAFRWPLPYGSTRESHFIEFSDDEPAPIRRLNAAGLLTAKRHPTPVVDRRLALDDALFRDDVIIFDELRSRCASFGADDGPRIVVRCADAPYFGVWTKPGAGFICLEPWHGVADLDGFSGDFTAKTGVFIVPVGKSVEAEMAITLQPS